MKIGDLQHRLPVITLQSVSDQIGSNVSIWDLNTAVKGYFCGWPPDKQTFNRSKWKLLVNKTPELVENQPILSINPSNGLFLRNRRSDGEHTIYSVSGRCQ